MVNSPSNKNDARTVSNRTRNQTLRCNSRGSGKETGTSLETKNLTN
jgi:hypothetical protein